MYSDTAMKQISTKYIPLLRNISELPSLLYIRGSLPDLSNSIVLSIVGSRNCSAYGRVVCKRMIEALAPYPVVILSGLALGIDTVAHETALRYGVPTIAVPGSGLNDEVIYPQRNRPLAQQMIHSGSCLLSEYPPTQGVRTWMFSHRNRIIAGLSHATLVIEAEERSGTNSTVQYALEYSRDVFAIPGSIFKKQSHGTNTLIQQGALLVQTPDDLISFLGLSQDLQKNDICGNNERNEVSNC